MVHSKKILSLSLIAVFAFLLLVVGLTVPLDAARAEDVIGSKKMIFEVSVATTATEDPIGSGMYPSVAAGDTFTLTYALVYNDGMAEALFTPSYDASAFKLTAFTVDTHYWDLFNSYGYTDSEGHYVPVTAAEYIEEYNEVIANGGTPRSPRLSFNVYFPEARDTAGTLSDHFLVVEYTALKDIPFEDITSSTFSFGFDMSDNGIFPLTHASTDSEDLMQLLVRTDSETTEPLGTEVFSISVRVQAAVTVPADQEVPFRYDGEHFYFDPEDVEVLFTSPAFEPEEANPYDGTVTYTFYERDPESGDLTPIVGVPTAPDLENIFVSVTLSDTVLYKGTTTEPVHVAVTPIYADAPALALTAGEEEPVLLTEDLTLTPDAVTYGTALTLSEIVLGEATDFPLVDTDLYDVAFYKQDGETFVSFESDPIATARIPVGTYRVTVTIKDSPFRAFNHPTDPFADQITITLTVLPAPLTLTAFAAGESASVITYGDAAPAYTYAVEGIVTGDDEEAILAALSIEARTSDAKPYAQYADAGEYVVTCYYTAIPDNYVLAEVVNATLTVQAKSLTLKILYLGEVAYFSCSGFLNDDEVAVRYLVDDEVITGVTYTATEDDYDLGEETLFAKVEPQGTVNYAAASLRLAVAHCISFLTGEGFENATEMPRSLYIFHGSEADEPMSTPLYTKFEFRYWADEEEDEFSFAGTEIVEDVELTAVWEQMVYTYRFRAINSTAAVSAPSRALDWSEQDEIFVVAAEAVALDRTKGDALPMAVSIRGFRVNRWYKVVGGVRTVATVYEADASTERDEEAYYLAEMTLDIGRGDVNADGYVTLEDVLLMKRYLVGFSAAVLEDEQDVWDVTSELASGEYFYLAVWDVNEDDSADVRDITAIRGALVGGYGYEIVVGATVGGVYVTGEQVAPVTIGEVNDVPSLDAHLLAGEAVILTQNIESDDPISVEYEGDVILDLGGKTFTVESLTVQTAGRILVQNGVLDADEISFTAAGGVIIRNVTDGAGDELWADGDETTFTHSAA